MPAYRLSRLARLDLAEIADYTVDIWGVDQAYKYLAGLEGTFERLVRNPLLGRKCDRIRAGYRRIEYKKHVVLYRDESNSVFVSRILHESMLPSRHLIEDE